MAGEEAGLAGAGEEAEVLRVGARGDRQLGLGGDRPHLGLGQLGQREAHARDRRGRQRGEHVGLVLGRIGGGAQQAVVGHPRVVAGGERRRAPSASASVEHRVQAHVAVAADARVRGLPRRVAGQERLDDARAELRPQVEREVREAHAVRDRRASRTASARAAGGGGVVLVVAPELQRHRDGVLADEQRGHGGVHAAAHRDEHAVRDRPAPTAVRAAAPSARCSASAARSAACSLPGESPPSSAAIARRAHARGVEQELALDQVHGRRARGGQRAAAVGVEARPRPRGRPRRARRRGSGRRTARRRRGRRSPPERRAPRPVGAARCSSKRSRSTTAESRTAG